MKKFVRLSQYGHSFEEHIQWALQDAHSLTEHLKKYNLTEAEAVLETLTRQM